MRKSNILFYIIIVCIIAIVFYNISNNESIANNPLDVQTFILDNGLTVYLNEDHNTTSVFGAVAVRGGGKRDPKDATGIAHYLEHLLFKGTQDMGTINYELEKVYLDSIELKYEELGKTSDENQRNRIQSDINKLSVKAAEYAIPNEFDRLIEGMGGSWVNAFTSNDAIVYLNKFPANQMEKWLEIYSHRFIDPVFRLFQAELETVYEEKNRSMDNVFSQAFQFYTKNFYKKHPYGQQTILGSVEHLKNPSLSKMQEYFDNYYVANNMALILSGDIYIEEIMPIIKEKFGKWKAGDIMPPINISEDTFKGRELINANITPIKLGSIGYRTVPANHDDEIILDLCIKLLSNQSKTGLIDQLEVEGKIQQSGVFNMNFVDHGGSNFFFFPLQGTQTLDEAEALVKQQIDKLKNGDFSDDFLNAVKITMIRDHEESIESMEGRLFNLINTYISDSSWENIINWPSVLDEITKDDVLRAANKYLGENYLVLHSNEGFPEKHKLEKPPFEPVIPKNAEEQSNFALKVDKIPEGDLNLQFIEFNKDVNFEEVSDNVHLYHTYNPINSIFELTLRFGIGNLEDPKLEQTSELLNLLGTENHSFNEFKTQLQNIGTTISFSSNRDYFKINVMGFDKYLLESIEYLNEFMVNVKGEDDKVKILVDSAISGRKIENEDPTTIGRAVRHYALYGNKSYWLRRMSVEEIEKSSAQDFLDSFNKALQYEVDILYTGRENFNRVSSLVKNDLILPDILISSNSPSDLSVNEVNENLIYFLNDESAVQSQIYFSISGNVIDDSNRSKSKAFNKYFSGGMSSIVFQEIREFRSLAYSAWANYSRPWRNGNKGNFIGFVGCQADKTLEAISVFNDITFNMPQKPDRMEKIKSGLIKSINSERPNFRSYPSKISDWVKIGYNDDPRKKQVSDFNFMTFNQVVEFQNEHIVGKPMVISILADQNRVDMKKLEKFGKIIVVNKEDVLN